MLSYRDLKAIQEGNRRNEDVMTLLREVKRLRDLVALSYSVIRDMPLQGLREEDISELQPIFEKMAAEPSTKEYLLATQKLKDLEFKRGKALEASHVRKSQTSQKP